jgi:hypothetical protein
MDIEDIKSIVSYDPESGAFRWVERRGRSPSGSIAGRIHKSGYIHIEIAGKHYSAHRLAWEIFYGSKPSDQIDHINRCKSDNRILNLREASNGQNRANTRSSSRHGLKGVAFKPWLKDNPWEARITVNRRVRSLGCFPTKEAAHSAYCEAAKIAHGDFFSH